MLKIYDKLFVPFVKQATVFPFFSIILFRMPPAHILLVTQQNRIGQHSSVPNSFVSLFYTRKNLISSIVLSLSVLRTASQRRENIHEQEIHLKICATNIHHNIVIFSTVIFFSFQPLFNILLNFAKPNIPKIVKLNYLIIYFI